MESNDPPPTGILCASFAIAEAMSSGRYMPLTCTHQRFRSRRDRSGRYSTGRGCKTQTGFMEGIQKEQQVNGKENDS